MDHLDLLVRRGACAGLLGPNGAGKTTTVEILEGLTRPDGGVVEVLGQRWTGGRADRRLRERLGVQLQETQLSDKLEVREVIRLFASFYQQARPGPEVIELLGLTDKASVRIDRLSGGQRQRVALACALVSAPEILFLDEPTTGLDPQARHRIWDVVAQFRADGGTVVLTTHYMEEAARLCDHVVIIDHGRVIAGDSPAALVASLGGGQIIKLTLDDDPASDDAYLEAVAGVRKVTRFEEEVRLTVDHAVETLPPLLAELARREIQVSRLTTDEATLEDVFISLTGRGLRDA